jgi:hypothetical protein
MSDDTTAKPEPGRSEYQALTNLSIGRRGDKDKAADFVPKGETVWLTEDEAARFLDTSRHKTAVIRPASEKNEPMPRITGAGMFGAKGRPAPPPVPEGSAALDVTNESKIGHIDSSDPANHPEAKQPDVTDPDAGNDGATARTRRGRST